MISDFILYLIRDFAVTHDDGKGASLVVFSVPARTVTEEHRACADICCFLPESPFFDAVLFKVGAGNGVKGVVLMVTLGTGIGSGLYVDGILVPNTEFGHIELDGHKDAERWAADSAREREDLKWGEWGKRVNAYLNKMHALLWPDLIILGGGVSKKYDKFSAQIDVPGKVVTATLLNEAGIVGAALSADL